MSAENFVDALSKNDNLGAETAFKDAMTDMVGSALETKRKELSKNYAQTVAATEDNAEDV